MASWFRSWHGAPTDPKWRVVARIAEAELSQVVATAWALLDCASQCPTRGSIDGADSEVIGESVGVPAEVVERILLAMHQKNILRDNNFAAWSERQPKREDDSSDRVTQHRERKRNAVKRTVTQCNAPDTDTESEAETEQRKTGTRARTDRREIAEGMSDLYDAVLAAMLLDHNCSAKAWQGVQSVVVRYAADGRTPEFVRRQAEWFASEHWIGKRGEPPKAEHLIDTAVQFAALSNGSRPKPKPPPVLTPEQIEKRDRALHERQRLAAEQMARRQANQ